MIFYKFLRPNLFDKQLDFGIGYYPDVCAVVLRLFVIRSESHGLGKQRAVKRGGRRRRLF